MEEKNASQLEEYSDDSSEVLQKRPLEEIDEEKEDQVGKETTKKKLSIPEHLIHVLDKIMEALNIGDSKDLSEELTKVCDPQVAVQIQHLDFPLNGVNALLIYFTILRQCYPDALLTILERRIVNLTAPVTASSTTSVTEAAIFDLPSPHEDVAKIKIEYICKFFGTCITTETATNLFRQFILSIIPFEEKQAILSLAATNPLELLTTDQEKELLSKYCVKTIPRTMEEVYFPLVSFTKGKMLPIATSSSSSGTLPLSYYIFELLITFNPLTLKIILGEFRFLALNEPPRKDL